METIIDTIEPIWAGPAAALLESDDEEDEFELVPVEELPEDVAAWVLAPGELISFSSSGTTARSEISLPLLSLTVTVTL